MIDSGKKPLILSYRKQAQDMVNLSLWQCEQSFDSPDCISLDKTKKLDTNQTEGDSFFPIPEEHNNFNSELQERAMMGDPLKMPM